MVVPPILTFLGSFPKITPNHLKNVRHIISATAPPSPADFEKLNLKLSKNSCYISQAYGLTEASPVLTVPQIPIKNLATVGAPVSNTLAKVISLDTGETLGPNQTGEICFKGPQVMLGYHNNPQATAETIDAEGWLKTGDTGYYDEDNHFYIQDRLKELIKVKGFQVAPAELEQVLLSHPALSEVKVMGVPDTKTGEVPVAFVVLKSGQKLTDKQLKDFLSDKVSKHKQVSEVIFLKTLPKTDVGKVCRNELREMYKNIK